ncbi:hypothetical protein J2772_004708 [Chryseobacterium jejuense]|nr:hypothetical protein [Chryseobacterium jejuense]
MFLFYNTHGTIKLLLLQNHFMRSRMTGLIKTTCLCPKYYTNAEVKDKREKYNNLINMINN